MNKLEELFSRYPALAVCESDIKAALDALIKSYRAGGKIPRLARRFCGRIHRKTARRHPRNIPALAGRSADGIRKRRRRGIYVRATRQRIRKRRRRADSDLDVGKFGKLRPRRRNGEGARNHINRADGSKRKPPFKDLRRGASRSRNGNIQSAGVSSACLPLSLRGA